MYTQVAAPRTRAYAHAVLILGLDINPGIVFSFPSFLSFFPSFSLLPMSGSFLFAVHNSPATPAADEIWVQKKRAVSDAPEAGCMVDSMMPDWHLERRFRNLSFAIAFDAQDCKSGDWLQKTALENSGLNQLAASAKSVLSFEPYG